MRKKDAKQSPGSRDRKPLPMKFEMVDTNDELSMIPKFISSTYDIRNIEQESRKAKGKPIASLKPTRAKNTLEGNIEGNSHRCDEQRHD